MTEKRVKEIVERFGKGWYPHEIEAIMAVAAEAREEAIDEMRDAIVRTTPSIRREWVWAEAEQLKEQG